MNGEPAGGARGPGQGPGAGHGQDGSGRISGEPAPRAGGGAPAVPGLAAGAGRYEPGAGAGEPAPAVARLAARLARLTEEAGPAMEELLADLVNHDSPSDHKPLLDRLAGRLQEELIRRGARVRRVRQEQAGDHLVARFFPDAGTRGAAGPGEEAAMAAGSAGPGSHRRRGILLLAHYDTVWPPGEAARRPFRREGGRGYGPGVFDMKAGIVIGLAALEALAALTGAAGADGAVEPPPVTFLLTSDEETGSRTSRTLIEELARHHQAVLVLEPAAAGRLKTARKGVGDFRLVVEGREAHAGNDPDRGVSAVEELARQILRLHALTDPGRGTTVNVGVVRGGLRPNVVAGCAEAAVDVRVATLDEARRIEDLFRRWEAVHPGARVELLGAFERPPMEFTPGNQALFRRAQAVGRRLGMDVEGTAVGGASDGNFTSALGVPTLDGLGATGDGAHSQDEHVDLDAMPRRAALVAGLILDLGERPLGAGAGSGQDGTG
ncbi:M20 family metallopeptidase [Thermaerobacter sp. PB12/4term]|uniref:M20 family metallopeptidase n=1 Tax=Thermaerobacter sp. PB12/4term TaxID=2293838 RepID=UPI001FADE324|nr:M20 family metallopeptidase [Thermaerobacter sp. PB12/4term]